MGSTAVKSGYSEVATGELIELQGKGETVDFLRKTEILQKPAEQSNPEAEIVFEKNKKIIEKYALPGQMNVSFVNIISHVPLTELTAWSKWMYLVTRHIREDNFVSNKFGMIFFRPLDPTKLPSHEWKSKRVEEFDTKSIDDCKEPTDEKVCRDEFSLWESWNDFLFWQNMGLLTTINRFGEAMKFVSYNFIFWNYASLTNRLYTWNSETQTIGKEIRLTNGDFKWWISRFVGKIQKGDEVLSVCSSISVKEFFEIFRYIRDVYEDESLKHPNYVCRELCKWMASEIGFLIKSIIVKDQ